MTNRRDLLKTLGISATGIVTAMTTSKSIRAGIGRPNSINVRNTVLETMGDVSIHGGLILTDEDGKPVRVTVTSDYYGSATFMLEKLK